MSYLSKAIGKPKPLSHPQMDTCYPYKHCPRKVTSTGKKLGKNFLECRKEKKLFFLKKKVADVAFYLCPSLLKFSSLKTADPQFRVSKNLLKTQRLSYNTLGRKTEFDLKLLQNLTWKDLRDF